MKYLYTLFIFLSLSLSYVSASEKDAVNSIYKKYRGALLEKNGKDAWLCIDKKTQQYYSTILATSLTIDRKSFDKSTILDKLIIARVRTEFNKSELEKMNGKALFVHAVKSGLIDARTVSKLDSLEDIKIDGDHATALHTPEYAGFHFIKEDSWKFSLVKAIEIGNQAMKKLCEANQMTEEQLLTALLSRLYPDFDTSVFNKVRD